MHCHGLLHYPLFLHSGMALMTFEDLVLKKHEQEGKLPFRGNLLCFDPGETTGWALFRSTASQIWLDQVGQIATWDKAKNELDIQPLLTVFSCSPTIAVFESYQVYDWKKDEHAWSQIPTVQVIGSIKTICQLRAVPFHGQTAQNAKQFMTDRKLQQWGFYREGLRHARDAIRHGAFFLMFGPKNDS